jgi:phosphatidylglycerophosphate synthase
VFVVAAATEFLDGHLARRMGIESLSGRILDPVADKVFVAAVLITLIRDGTLTPLGAAAVAARDLLVWAGILVAWVARGRSALERMPPRLLGKLATAAQFFWILGVLVLGRSVAPLMVVAASLSFAAGIDYLATGARRILAGPRPS